MTDNLLKATNVLIDAIDEGARPKLRDFIATLEHEIISNVTGINGFSKLLLEDKDGQLSEKQQKALHYIQKRAENIREILAELSTPIIVSLKGEI